MRIDIDGIWTTLEGAVKEELALGGDAGSVVARLRQTLSEERHVVVPVPTVAHKGPYDTDASMLLSAADRLDCGDQCGGSNLRRAVAELARSAANAAEGLLRS